jgi:hypothetical protein
MLPQVKRSYDEQGYIFFFTRLYPQLPQEDRECIENLCKSIAGDSWEALLEFIRSDDYKTKVSLDHNVSCRTLIRWQAEYYTRFFE